MDLAKVKEKLLLLGSPCGGNPESNCTVCAVLAARSLVSGIAPTGRASEIKATKGFHIGQKAAKDGATKILDIQPDHMRDRAEHSRAYLVWTWLTKPTQNGVYVFEQAADHVYNFVVDGSIYLIDTATYIAKKVNTPGDCSVATAAYPANFETETGANTEYGYNYLNPQPDEDPNTDNLCVYRWGDLNRFWR